MRGRIQAIGGTLLLALGLSVAGLSQTLPKSAPANVIASLPATAAQSAHLVYSFDMHADVTMHTFPWLKFHISGDGRHEANGDLLLHLNGMPWFAKAYQDVNLASVLEPTTWASQYTVASAQRRGSQVTLVLHDRHKTKLTDVRATVDDTAGVQELEWNYSYGGRIRLSVQSAVVAGYTLPAAMSVSAEMPQYAATARAAFTNYSVIGSADTEQGSATER